MPFLPPNEQCQSTEGKSTEGMYSLKKHKWKKKIKEQLANTVRLENGNWCVHALNYIKNVSYNNNENNIGQMKCFTEKNKSQKQSVTFLSGWSWICKLQ